MVDTVRNELTLPKDSEPKENRFGVFADDQKGRAQSYARPFLGLKSFTPIVLEKGSTSEASAKLDKVNLAHIDIAVIEEFYDNHYLREYMIGFMKRLRDANPNAFIVETGALAGRAPHQFYQDSNRLVMSFDMMEIASSLLRMPPNLKARINALKTLTVEGFIQAGKADDRTKDFDIGVSLRSAEKNSLYMRVLKMLSIESNDFKHKVEDLPQESERDIMHTLWSIIGHLQIGNSPDDYGMSLDRLKRSLTAKPAVSLPISNTR